MSQAWVMRLGYLLEPWDYEVLGFLGSGLLRMGDILYHGNVMDISGWGLT
jgi:hypothetical protein